MTTRIRSVILSFAILGLLFAGASTWIHYKLLADPCYASPCDINARFNCTDVYMSRFGAVGGVPVALGGLVWFGLVALIAGLAKPTPKPTDDPSGAYLFVLATIGLATIFYLGYASYFVLHRVCILCAGTYVSVVAIFIASGTASSVAVTSLPGRLARDFRTLTQHSSRAMAAVLFVAAVAAMVTLFPKVVAGSAGCVRASAQAAPADARKAFEDSWAAQPRVDTGVPADGAAVVIVKFNDWECAACKAAFLQYQPILKKYADTMPGAVKYVTKDFPLHPTCNVNVPQVIHPSPCEAAAAVRIAREHGKGDEMETWIFDHQQGLVMVHPETSAKDIKAEVQSLTGITDFDKQYEAKLPDIRRDVADGTTLHVGVTPTYFINGVRAADSKGNWLPPQYLEMAIEYELKKAGKK